MRAPVLPPRDPVCIDAVFVGETMGVLTAADAVAEGTLLNVGAGGAESNAALALAQLGHRTAWVSRVGRDPFGRVVIDSVARWGVDVRGVVVDPGRPTGLYVKDTAPGGAGVLYYRSGSAASELGPSDTEKVWSRGPRLVHLSGITPALGPGPAALVRDLLDHRPARPVLRSFDVNHRPALWTAGRAGPYLLDLARRADLVLVGRDEAERLWGCPTAAHVRALMDEVPILVVKDAEYGATCFDADGEVFVPASPVEVIEEVGAGDAFAAGFLSGTLDGLPRRRCLELGHAVAGAVLGSAGDTLAGVPETVARIRS